MMELSFSREAAIDMCSNLINSYASRYSYVDSIDDVKQELAMSVLRAYDNFDESKNVPFQAYATIWMKESMQRYYAEHNFSCKLNRPVLQRRKAILDIIQENPTLSYDDIASLTGYSTKQIDEALREYYIESVDRQVSDDNETSMLDRIQSEDSSPDILLERRAKYELLTKCMKKYLTDNESFVLMHRTGFYCDVLTIEEIGVKIGCTHQYVSKLYKQACEKMRNHSSELVI